MKAAILILSDPRSGAEDALGRVFNGLAAAYDFKHRGDDVTILFQGAGTRWPAELAKEDHPGHGLYEQVLDKVAGVSCGCAEVFGATADSERLGLELLRDSEVPGTSGLPSLAALTSEGYSVLTF